MLDWADIGVSVERFASYEQMLARAHVGVSIERFSSYEQMLVCYRALTNATQLRLTAGPTRFFAEFRQWYNAPDAQTSPLALGIPPDPTTSLIFPNLRDELLAALRVAMDAPATEAEARDILSQYGLQEEHLLRPITALSGGERLLGAFAKAHALAPTAPALVLSNPTHWLNPTRHRFVDHLLERYAAHKRPVHVLALEGEPFRADVPSLAPVSNWDSANPSGNWQLKVEAPVIHFPEISFPDSLPSKTIRFVTERHINRLPSPTWMVGDNGVGKSLFAKCLAGVLPLSSGTLSAAYEGTSGPVRLVMQDAISQLFGQSIDQHLSNVFRYDTEARKKAVALTETIENALRDVVARSREMDQAIIGASAVRDSLLQAKIVLAAERITTRPPIIILDEPGWCMPADLARAFVCAVCVEAAKVRVGVVIIAHQEGWWGDIARSMIRLSRRDSETVEIKVKVRTDVDH